MTEAEALRLKTRVITAERALNCGEELDDDARRELQAEACVCRAELERMNDPEWDGEA
jgi:hypothetical protein